MNDLKAALAHLGPAIAANLAARSLLHEDLVGPARVVGVQVDTLNDGLVVVGALVGARATAIVGDVSWSRWRLVVEYDGTIWTASLERCGAVMLARGQRLAAYQSTELRTALSHLVGDVAWPADVRVAA